MNYAIEVKGLVKVYDGKVRALDGVDLKVKAGLRRYDQKA